MPDIRTLLDDVTTRTPTADPVAAVHAHVRRRTTRRRAGVAAGATLALAATGVGVARLPGRTNSTIRPAHHDESWQRLDRSWRWQDRAPGVVVGVEDGVSIQRLWRLVDSNPEVFLGVTPKGNSYDDGFVVTFLAGADPAAWADEIRAVGATSWAVEQCADDGTSYDEVAGELMSAAWPSGQSLYSRSGGYVAVAFRGGCRVTGEMWGPPDPRDVAYARARWGERVRLVERGHA